MPIGHTVATGNPYAQTGGAGALMAAQNVPICTVDVLTGIGSMSVQIGGYRLSSAAQRELQRVT